MFEFKSNNLILIGDTHNIYTTNNIISGKNFGEGYDVIFMGDGGEIGFISFMFESLNNKLIEKNNRMIYLRGNHSNPEFFKASYSNIVFPKTLDVGLFPNEKKCLFVNGGLSIDRMFRKLNIDYWKEEITEDFEDSHVSEVDIIFAHDAPECFNYRTDSLQKKFNYVTKDVVDESYVQRNKMTRIMKKSKCKKWYSGHFHNSCKDIQDDVEYRCLDINESLEINV